MYSISALHFRQSPAGRLSVIKPTAMPLAISRLLDNDLRKLFLHFPCGLSASFFMRNPSPSAVIIAYAFTYQTIVFILLRLFRFCHKTIKTV